MGSRWAAGSRSGRGREAGGEAVGAGLGASHQTGWTGVVAKFIQLYGLLDPKGFLEAGKGAAFLKGAADAREQ